MPRLTAWKILRSGTTGPLRDVTPMAEREGLDPRDRALLRRLVGTEVRRRGSLRAIASHFTRGKPSPDILTHVRLGLAQLLYLDQVPDHAALSETVRAVSDSLGLSKSRYVNGVLRTAQRFLREGTSGDPTRDVYGRDWHFEFPIFRDPEQHYYLWVEDALSIPSALFKRWDKRYGRETALGLAQAAQESPGVSLRAVSVTADALRDELRGMPAVDEDAPALDPLPGDHPACLRLPSSAIGAVMRSAAFWRGAARCRGRRRCARPSSSGPRRASTCSICAVRPAASRRCWPAAARG